MATRTCRANIGTRKHSRACGKPIAEGMLASCKDHATRLIPTGDKAIYTRGSRYVVVWLDRGKQHKEFFHTKAEAKEARGTRQAGERKAFSKARFDDYAEHWLESYGGRTKRGLDEDTRALYRDSITRFAIPYFGRYKLADIERRDVRAFAAWLAKPKDEGGKGLAAASVRKVVVPLKALLATALDDDDVRANPAAGLRLRLDESEDDDAKALTGEELALWLAAVPPEWAPFFGFLVHTGMRISEALGLTWDRVELGVNPCVRVDRQRARTGSGHKRLKSANSRRTIPLSPGMAATLRELRAQGYRGEESYVWAAPRGGPHQYANVRSRVLQPTGRALGLEWVTFHSFRHTCASLLFASGKNIKQVQEWLGHADPGFTLRTYVHLMDDGLGSAEFLDEILPPERRLAFQERV